MVNPQTKGDMMTAQERELEVAKEMHRIYNVNVVSVVWDDLGKESKADWVNLARWHIARMDNITIALRALKLAVENDGVKIEPNNALSAAALAGALAMAEALTARLNSRTLQTP